MAVQQRRNSKTRKNKRRTHYKLNVPTLVKNAAGEYVRPHHEGCYVKETTESK